MKTAPKIKTLIPVFLISLLIMLSCSTNYKVYDSSAENLESYESYKTLEEQPGIYDSQEYNTTEFNTESYDAVFENEFLTSIDNPLSTFSIDVDNASYSNVRRMLAQNHRLPPKDAVRIEEFINYFNYKYPDPTDNHPFNVITELGDCPWNSEHKLLHIGMQGKNIPLNELNPSNLVFLIDVSGSMSDYNKLPLLKQSFKMLVNKLDQKDRVAIVVYAGAAGLVLPSTSCDRKDEIINALDGLESGGSTAGGAGLKLAYKVAQENFIEDGNNRILIATDGDFNVGPSSNGVMVRMMEENRDHGVYITVLGFGMGNYKDSKMEKIADHGNGNYFYIDNAREAKKVLVTGLGGTLHTIAKDVKIQIEFNPAKVNSYRLIGYENRMLKKEDFNNDAKDAGELGAGHTVTALYEIITTESNDSQNSNTDPLRYQDSKVVNDANNRKELVTIKLRYKLPNEDKSSLISTAVTDDKDFILSDNFRFSAAVASFGMVLRDSKFKGTATYNSVLELAKSGLGEDDEGHRAEFLRLVETSQALSENI